MNFSQSKEHISKTVKNHWLDNQFNRLEKFTAKAKTIK